MKEVVVEEAHLRFARVMEVCTMVALLVVALPAMAYFVGVGQFVELKMAQESWHLPVSEFWQIAGDGQVSGYAWFLGRPMNSDCLCLLGVSIMALTPLLSVVGAITKSRGVQRVLLVIVSVELAVAMLRPLFTHVVGH